MKSKFLFITVILSGMLLINPVSANDEKPACSESKTCPHKKGEGCNHEHKGKMDKDGKHACCNMAECSGENSEKKAETPAVTNPAAKAK